MQNQFIEVNQIKVAYIEKNKEARKTIFFIHGNSVSKGSWSKQYDSNLLSAYRLIAIDLPLHGDSEVAADASNLYLKRTWSNNVILLSSAVP